MFRLKIPVIRLYSILATLARGSCIPKYGTIPLNKQKNTILVDNALRQVNIRSSPLLISLLQQSPKNRNIVFGLDAELHLLGALAEVLAAPFQAACHC